MKTFTLLLAFSALVATSSAGMLPKKVIKKLAMKNFWSTCWGKQTTLDYYLAVKAAQKECLQMVPKAGVFDSVFGAKGNDRVDSNRIAGSGVDSQFVQNGAGISDPAASYQSWLQFLAYQQQFKAFQQQSQQELSSFAKKSESKRWKRAIEEPTEEDIAEFNAELAELKESYMDGVSNVTCVLMTLGALDNMFMINKEYFVNDMWKDIADRPDPLFKKRMVQAYEDCHAFAAAIPDSILERDAKTKFFGRQKAFFKCAHKMETDICGKKQIADWLEEWYGPYEDVSRYTPDLPEDKYEGAVISYKVLEHSQSDIEKFVTKAIFNPDM